MSAKNTLHRILGTVAAGFLVVLGVSLSEGDDISRQTVATSTVAADSQWG
ncbi:hypothetical protein OHB11_10085 [Streptomyces zaomyceticus]|uniref:Uncharacterized protein n=1 Tax=Streptomyces zaomyceticus TaxID=68286 RepID=A0ABZ1L570_9ACTN|nr:hypothetical protein OG237_31640 [Streptomyces zaomyceticus]